MNKYLVLFPDGIYEFFNWTENQKESIINDLPAGSVINGKIISDEIKEIDRQIKEAKAASNSPYLVLDQKIEAKRREKELIGKRLRVRQEEILKDFENTLTN